MKNKLLSILVIAAMSFTVLAGCSTTSTESSESTDTTESTEAATDSEGGKVVGVVIANANMPFCQDMVTGITAGLEDGDTILEYAYDEDPTVQAEIIGDLIVKDVDVIITNVLDVDSIVASLKQCDEAGIPVILMDGQLAEENEALAYATVENDVYNIGYIQGKAMCESIGGEGQVGYLFWTAASDSAKLRVQGFLDAIAEYPDVEVVSEATSTFDTDSALEAVDAALQLYPELDGYWATWAAAGLASVSSIGNAGMTESCYLGISDFEADFATYMEDGKVDSCVYLNTVNMGALAIEAAYSAMNGETLEDNHLVNSEQTLVTLDNVDEFLALIQ